MICICRILSDISSISICCISISRFMDLLLACVCVVSFTYLEMPCVTYSEIPCDIVTYVQTCWPIVIFLDEFIISFHSWFPDMFNQFISCQPLESTGSPRVPLSAQGERCQRLHFGVDYHLGGPPFCALAPGESEKSWEYPNSWFWLNQKKQSGCHNFGNLPFLGHFRHWPAEVLARHVAQSPATLREGYAVVPEGQRDVSRLRRCFGCGVVTMGWPRLFDNGHPKIRWFMSPWYGSASGINWFVLML